MLGASSSPRRGLGDSPSPRRGLASSAPAQPEVRTSFLELPGWSTSKELEAVDKTLQRHSKVATSTQNNVHAKTSHADLAASQAEHAVSARRADAALRSWDGARGGGSDWPWSTQHLYPQRWYDSFLPVNLPWDDRGTRREHLDSHWREVNTAFCRVRAERRVAYKSERRLALRIATCSVPTIILGLPLAVQLLEPVHRNYHCSEGNEDWLGHKCYDVPDWRVCLGITTFVFCAIKLMTLDFARHFTQLTPLQFRGSVPSVNRPGIAGLMERLGSIWHFVNTPIVILPSMWQYWYKFSVRRLEVLPRNGTFAMTARETDAFLENKYCIENQHEDNLVHRVKVFFGGLHMLIFMTGACAIIVGEICKVRPRQRCALKKVLDLRPFLNHTTGLRTCDLFHTLRGDISELLGLGWDAGQSGAERGTEEMDKQLGSIVQRCCKKLRRLFDAEMAQLIHLADRKRLYWTAALQCFGFTLWLPATLTFTSPCLGMDSKSAEGQLFSKLHKQSDLQGQCHVALAFVFVLLALGAGAKLIRPFALQVADSISHLIFILMLAYVALMADWRCFVLWNYTNSDPSAGVHGGRTILTLQHVLICTYAVEVVVRLFYQMFDCTTICLEEVQDFESQVIVEAVRLLDLVVERTKDPEVHGVVARWSAYLEHAIERETTEHILRFHEDSDDDDDEHTWATGSGASDNEIGSGAAAATASPRTAASSPRSGAGREKCPESAHRGSRRAAALASVLLDPEDIY